MQLNVLKFQDLSDRQGKIKCITLLRLIKVRSNKMHQGGNYQDFLKWRGEAGEGGGERGTSFSYDI